MTLSAYSRLGKALALSILLHATLLAAGLRLPAPPSLLARTPQAQLTVLLEQLTAAETPEPLLLPPQSTAAAKEPAPPPAAREPRLPPEVLRTERETSAQQMLSGAAARHANEQITRELLYPPEAIARGLQGEALVLLFLDASGNAIAARLEASSGHALLDEAAVHAARTLRALPASAPREALLPVRFKLQ